MARRHIESPWASAGDTGTAPNLSEQQTGWQAGEPAFQLFNWLQNLITEFLEHLEQNGIAEWDVETPYATSGVCKGSDDLHYIAVQPTTGDDPTVDDGTNWILLLNPATTDVRGVVELATPTETTTGLDPDKAVTPLSLSARIATTLAAGMVQLATQAETQALITTSKAVTPHGLDALQASESQRGLTLYATLADLTAGVADDKAVTPEALALGQSLGPNGYKQLPGGLIIQWGFVDFNNVSAGTNIPLPISFPNNHYAASAGGRCLTRGTSLIAMVEARPNSLDFVLVSVAIVAGTERITWIAIGD